MADNVNIPSSGSVQVATKDIGGIEYPKVIVYDTTGAAVPFGSNVEGSLLASAARTATNNTAVQTNTNARGVLIRVLVTAAGTSTVTPQILGATFDRASFFSLLDGPAITGAGWWAFCVYPGATPASSLVSSKVSGAASLPLPRSWLVTFAHGDSSSWTYSATYDLIV